jgi:hypothetical protein
VKYRWLDSDQPVVCVGKRSTQRGRIGHLILLPLPGHIANALVDFDGKYVVCPAGTLRRQRGE